LTTRATRRANHRLSNVDPAIPPVQHFASRAVRTTLGRSTDVDVCVELVGQVDRLLEQAAAHLQGDGASLACRAGCNFCCHLRVMVLPHEAIALFRYLQSRMPVAIADRVREKLREYTRAAAALASPASSAPESRRACAFLVDGECAAYEARPSACAAYHSLSRERCEQSFQNPSLPAATEALQALQVVAMALEEGVNAGLQTQGLSNMPVELHTGVAALLGNPALIARWRAGRTLTQSSRDSGTVTGGI
jgi:Fe-S-cluster containining protein